MEVKDPCFMRKRIDSLLLDEPSVYLKCPICNRVYCRPVINVKCGHTFCEDCISNLSEPGNGYARCPLDGESCGVKSLIINRVLQDQVNNLLIRCTVDRSHCTNIIKYGEAFEHETVCQYALIECPNAPQLCPKIKRRDLIHHVNECHFKLSTLSVLNNKKDSDLIKINDSVTVEQKISVLLEAFVDLNSKVNEIFDRLKKIEDIVLMPSPSIRELDYESIEEFVGRNTKIHSLHCIKTNDDFWVMPFQFKCVGTMRCHSSTVTSISLWNRTVFSSDVEGNIKMWSLSMLEKGSLKTLKVGKKKINATVIYKDCLYTAGDDLVIKCWGTNLVEEIASVANAHEKSITSLLCSADKLFSASFTNVKVWRCRTLDHLHVIKGLHHWARSLATNISNDKLYIGAHGMIAIWKSCNTFESIGKIIEPIGSVYSLTVTKQFIIAGTYNKNINIYDVDTFQNVHHFTGHVGIINCLISPSVQKFFISCSSDSTILLWCLDKMLPVQAIQRHDASVTCAATIDDILLTGSEDSEIKIFRQFKSALN